jgi:hypothetical protein
MANGLENGPFGTDLVNSPGLREPLGLHQKYREHIQNKLEEFLPAHEARDTAMQVYDLALEIDEEIGRILKDPVVRRLYDYDGRFFTPRGTELFHAAFDGFHIRRRPAPAVSRRTSFLPIIRGGNAPISPAPMAERIS